MGDENIDNRTSDKRQMTPGQTVKEIRTILERKHEILRNAGRPNVVGGVSLWPNMASMRLTKEEVRNLVAVCVVLCGFVTLMFYLLHGSSILELLEFQRKLSVFPEKHPILIKHGQEQLDKSVVQWHSSYREIVDLVHQTFDVTSLPTSYMVYILLYVATIAVLFYYLLDNMFAKSKLSPKRIKRWVCLLTLTGTCTFLMIFTLVVALQTESAIESNIHLLSDILADVAVTSLSCDEFNTVLQYWRTRCLPPTTHGTISIFGVLPVRDVMFYLQYYAIPIATVLIMSVFKLVVSVMTL